MPIAEPDTYKINGCHEFFHGDFFLSAKVMKVSDQAGHHFSQSRRSLWSCSVDDIVREVRVKLVSGSIRSSVCGHGVVYALSEKLKAEVETDEKS